MHYNECFIENLKTLVKVDFVKCLFELLSIFSISSLT